MSSRILLLGKNGQVGWELQRALAPLGEVHARDSSTCDLANDQLLRETLREIAPNCIVNAAAYTAVDKAEQEREAAFRINANAVATIAEYAAKHSALFVHYSTDYVFDGCKPVPYDESDATHPLSVYGASKRAGEEAIIASGCAHLIFRTSWVFAARGSNFAKTMLRLGAEREELRVVADQFGAPTSAELIADVTAHALRATIANPALCGLYHLAASGETSWHGYARTVIETARALELPMKVKTVTAITTEQYPLPAPRPANSRLNCEKLERAFVLKLPHWRFHVERVLQEIMGNTNGNR